MTRPCSVCGCLECSNDKCAQEKRERFIKALHEKLATEKAERKWAEDAASDALSDMISEMDDLRTSVMKANWQPIETAPKDSEDPILVWDPTYYQGKGGHDLVVWAEDSWWRLSGARKWFPTEPAYWMPLPKGPEIKPTTKKEEE